MTISKAQIFNVALNILGVSTPLENTNSQEPKAIILNNCYELARDYVLKDFDWNFASFYRVLTKTNEQNTSSDFLYSYDYPNDCISAREVFNKTTGKSAVFYITSDESSNTIILTNCESAILRYTKRISKETYFSPEFSMALSYYLAALTSNTITGSIQKGEFANQKYKEILKRAKLLNAREGADFIEDNKTYLDGRN